MSNLFLYKNKLLRDGRIISILSFSLFYGWLWCLAFEGKVFYAMAQKQCSHSEIHIMMQMALIFQFFGLFLSGFFIKNAKQAKKIMLIAIFFCIYGSLVFFLPFSVFWYISIMLVSMLAGIVVGGWGFWIQSEVPQKKRVYIAADILILSNVFEILTNVITVNVSQQLGLLLCIILLIASMIFTTHLPKNNLERDMPKKIKSKSIGTEIPIKLLIILYLFMTIITINWGLMYTIICSDFAHIEKFTSWYWCTPYLIAVYIMRRFASKTNRYSILFVVIAMSGFSFIFYGILDNSLTSYVIINTLMLGSYGLCDLFSWSILGEILDYTKNPAKIFGIGLSANVLGIVLGRMIANRIIGISSNDFITTIIAISVGFIVIIILPILYKQLSVVLDYHDDPLNLEKNTERHLVKLHEEFLLSKEITEREKEIIEKILQGKTYKMISEELFLSINTVKFHIKNIYSKLNVHNRQELIGIIEKNGKKEKNYYNSK